MAQVSASSSKHSPYITIFFALITDLSGSHARCISWRSAQTGYGVAWSPSKLFGPFHVDFCCYHFHFADILNRSNIGSIVCSVMMQQLNQKHPDNYLLAMRILWAPIGLMIICWVIVPESPWFHARHGNKEKAIKSMQQLYSGVKGYDFEEEYGIIARTIEHEKEILQEMPRYIHIFKGTNLVSAFQSGEHQLNNCQETYPHRHDPRHLPAIRWPHHHQYIFDLCVAYSFPASILSSLLMAQTFSPLLVCLTHS
jgi:hypothetical protein